APAQGPDLLDGGDLDAVRRPSLGRTVEALDVCPPLGDRLLRVRPYRPLVLRARTVHLPVRPAPVHRVLRPVDAEFRRHGVSSSGGKKTPGCAGPPRRTLRYPGCLSGVTSPAELDPTGMAPWDVRPGCRARIVRATPDVESSIREMRPLRKGVRTRRVSAHRRSTSASRQWTRSGRWAPPPSRSGRCSSA